ncbi:histidine-rich glycoprotein-like isoform X2 [Daphnia pulicaria]|uniref:histidine-rich glycoprotein-like isoform X2 n=1 Tax=Daphnia pulicaria TaxID=35523 RepID=UPI001EEA37D7|nr:histidine-rich glycoprotein-like isoform X2 [Daphnia pulicaria]
MPRSTFLVVFTVLMVAVVVAFPQPNSDDSPAAVVVETPAADTPDASAPPVEGESVDLRFRPSYGYGGQQYGGQQYGGQQYGSNYYSSERYESHHSSQQYGHQNYGHQNYGHQNYGHQNYGHQNYGHNAYGNYGHGGYDRPYGHGGYPGGYGYYGRPQGILGAVGNVLDGLLGLREGEKKPAVDGDASAAPVVAAAAPEAVDPVFPEADSVPQIPVEVGGNLPEPALQSEGVPSAGEEVIFQ